MTEDPKQRLACSAYGCTRHPAYKAGNGKPFCGKHGPNKRMARWHERLLDRFPGDFIKGPLLIGVRPYSLWRVWHSGAGTIGVNVGVFTASVQYRGWRD